MPKIYGVTTQTSDSTDQRIGIIKKTTDGFAYSVDGSTFETISTGGSSGGGSKGFDYVIAPSDSGVTDGVDLVLPGTADQTAINNLITMITSSGKKSATIKFLGGTVRLTDTINISNAIINFISDGTTILQMTEAKTIFNYNYFGRYEGFVRLEGLVIETAAVTPVTLKSTLTNNVLVSNCFFKTYLSIDLSNGNLILENCNVENSTQIIPGSTDIILYNCNFAEDVNINSELACQYIQTCNFAGNFICKKFTAIDSSNFKGNFTVGMDSLINSGNISNCQFLSNVNIISDSNHVNVTNCIFGDPAESLATTINYGNCIFTNCFFTNFNELQLLSANDTNTNFDNCTFEQITFKKKSEAEFTIGSCSDCLFEQVTFQSTGSGTTERIHITSAIGCKFEKITITSPATLAIETMINCEFVGLKVVKGTTIADSDPAIYCVYMTDCVFNTTSIVPAYNTFISDVYNIGLINGCVFRNGTTIDAITTNNGNFTLLSGYAKIENCIFDKLKCTSIDQPIVCIGNSANVSNIEFANPSQIANSLTLINANFDSTKDLLSIANIKSYCKIANNFTFIGATNCKTIKLHDIYLAQSGLIGLNNYSTCEIENLLIDLMTTLEISESAFIIGNSTIYGLGSLTVNNLTIQDIQTDCNFIQQSQSKLHLRLSNIQILNIPSEYIFKFHQQSSNSSLIYAICDNIYIANGSLLENYFNSGETVYYSNYTGNFLNGNYSSNVALKYINDKPYIYNDKEKVWSPLQIGYVTYGVQVDLSNSNPSTSCTYTDDAVGMTPGTSWLDQLIFKDIKPCLFNIQTNGVADYLNPNDFGVSATTGSPVPITNAAYSVMIEFPKIGYKISKNGTTLNVQITNDPNKNGFSYKAFTRDTEGDRDKLYIGAYLGSSSTETGLRSLSGATPSRFTTFAAARDSVRNIEVDGYDLIGFNQLTLLQCLYLIMYKNLNSQTALGWGYWMSDQSGESIPTNGSTNSKGMCFGAQNLTNSVKFLGIENIYCAGVYSQLIDGVKISNDGHLLVGTKNFNNDGTGYTQTSSTVTSDGGPVSDVVGTNEAGFIGKKFTGSTSTYFCDIGAVAYNSQMEFGAGGAVPTTHPSNDPDTGMFAIVVSAENGATSNSFVRLMYL